MLFLSGGGDEAASAPLDRDFATAVGGGRLLYIPVAMDGGSPTYAECHAWLQGVFAPLGIADIVMWSALSPPLAMQLNTFAAVYLGGGNTYRLLAILRQSGFDGALRDFAHRGGHLYGGSAGAIVLGQDIATCPDPNDVGLADTRGLGLLGRFSVSCHHTPSHDRAIERRGGCTLAIPERSGVRIAGRVLTVAGPDPIVVFSGSGRTVLGAGETIAVTA